MTPEQIDKLSENDLRLECAKGLGCTPVKRGVWWHCGCMNRGGYGTAEHDDIEMGWLKLYSSNIAAAFDLQADIERRGLQALYAKHLIAGMLDNESKSLFNEMFESPLHVTGAVTIFDVANATPAQRCRAYLKAIYTLAEIEK